ncbi:uncharacterized protein LOC131624867 [Vicia villosa]|uniref:uncharacterized protein LOC131624867 n=1 Tax=Vicia villosa TaxID=3911 RepID=UPI00273A7637|nr:uncharacterized protein LOC131624867 [Vicia villosa]
MERKNYQKNSGIFNSMFSNQSPLVLGRESVRYEVNDKVVKKTLNSLIKTQDDISNKNHGNEAQNTQNNNMSSTNHDQRIHQCNFTSSIYYGGQDIIPNTQTTQNAGVTSFNNWEKDDSGAASRGDWWKGGLYY